MTCTASFNGKDIESSIMKQEIPWCPYCCPNKSQISNSESFPTSWRTEITRNCNFNYLIHNHIAQKFLQALYKHIKFAVGFHEMNHFFLTFFLEI